MADTTNQTQENTQKAFNTAQAAGNEAKDRMQAVFGEFNERSKAAVEKSSKLFEEMNDIAKGNVEAFVESGKIAAKGAEEFSQDAAEASRRYFENATQAMKRFASVKSPTEFFQLQSEYVRSAFDSMVSDSSKHSEAALKLAGDIAQPISNRFSVVSEKVKTLNA